MKIGNSSSRFSILFLLLNSFFFCYGSKSAFRDDDKQIVNIGGIIEVNSRMGREEKIAMELAVLNFNNHSKYYNLSLHIQDHQAHPLKSVLAAETLIKEKSVKAIIGMERWNEASLVAEIGNQAQIPILSFSRPAITPPLSQFRWPFLARMAYNNSEQMNCIAELTRLYNWRRVITVYEDNGDYGDLALLSQALQKSGRMIEHNLVLPSISSLYDRKKIVKEELRKLEEVKSRVFIVLQTSLPLVIHLFREAKEMGFVGKDSVWILTESVTSFLDSVDISVIYSMEGALGIRTTYSDSSREYTSFYSQFRRSFRSEYPEEDNSEPGYYALRAYDSITTITKAMEEMSNNFSNSKSFLNHILLSDFTGLSGQIQFKEGELLHSPTLRIVNVVGKKYKEIDLWEPEFGFKRSRTGDEDVNDDGGVIGLESPVNWPGDLKRSPKGWAMPSNAKPMIIGVPGRTAFSKFVEVVDASKNIYDGYCIDLFRKVEEVLGYNLSYRFVPYYGTYDDLVNHVYNKTYDAIVGDITILAERVDKVDFTQPYAESGLSMIVPVKSEESAWMFMKPFTWQMWVVTVAILIYTMFIVWFLEHQINPEFSGSLKNQVGTTVWYTFSSLFFAHKEKIYSNLTRLVIVVWLFVVLILTSSYTASLSSTLTIKRLQPNVTDIEWLIKNNLPVGCDGDSFVRNYLVNVLKFKLENIKTVSSEYNYTEAFRDQKIYAAFVELPYQKVFTNQYCKKFVAAAPTFTFGGLGFVFQRGSPLRADVSKAILKLSENGTLKDLEKKWFAPSSECTGNANDNENESLSLKSFWGLYLISGATSTICLLLFLIRSLKKYCHYRKIIQGSATPSEKSTVWGNTITLAKYIYNGESAIPGRSSNFSQTPNVHGWIIPSWESASSSNPGSFSASTPPEIEVVNIPENLQDSDRELRSEA
ncbi:glutamate receptor 2.7-like [Mercurialis annua]|uniref:glutamate receptor 2.7-like n=1 Tax=Mercurialis annua TaxID=3986 RepID=UPI00215EBE72|nr:glutamate receptor 2.7-like [Mercurialis annua]